MKIDYKKDTFFETTYFIKYNSKKISYKYLKLFLRIWINKKFI